MNKKKVLKIAIIVILSYAVFATVVLIGFYAIQNDPVDIVAIPYLRYDTNIAEEYGEIDFISRYFSFENPTQKSENTIKSTYCLELETKELIVYVTLIKEENEWVPISYDIIKERPKND